MSDPLSQPSGEGPTNNLRTLLAPPSSKQHISMPQLTTSVGAMAMPWDTTQDEDPEARRREHLRRHYEQSNPYDTSRFAGSLARDRSRSPMALPSPMHRSTPLRETSQLPPLSDILAGPFNGVQQQDSYMRSTAQRTCPPNVMSSPTPAFLAGEGNSLQWREHPDLPPLSDFPSPSDFTPLPTPYHARQNIDRPASPATTEPGENGTPCPTTNAAAGPEMELDPKEEDADDRISKYSIVCEFSSPCHMTPSPDGMHYRKVVSHVFGRNKASTKLFPDAVWVHYCRKHYQRARYRADQWPFTQCELLLESINRMEEWGGVQKFELILRRREMLRVEDGKNPRARKAGSPNSLHSGRKHPTAVVSPVPDWLRERCGREMSFDDIRNLVVEIRGYMVELREEEKERRQGQQETAAGNASSSKGSGDASGKGEARQQASRVRFPDIEILPKFKKWVIDAALRKRASQQNVVQRADDDEAEVESVSDIGDDDMDEDCEKETPTDEVGRTGTNNGSSQSQRRRSERIFLRMVEGKGVARVSARRAVEKSRGKK